MNFGIFSIDRDHIAAANRAIRSSFGPAGAATVTRLHHSVEQLSYHLSRWTCAHQKDVTTRLHGEDLHTVTSTSGGLDHDRLPD